MLRSECPHCGTYNLYFEGYDIVCLVCGYREPQGNAYVRDVSQERICWPYPATLILGDDGLMDKESIG
jgi:uncharacterized Zn finger protein (UPF0148 family)